MKKIILIVIAVILVFMVYKRSNEDNLIIPNEAIRFRILANSNSPRDQKIKEDIRDKMQEKLYMILKNTENIKSARKIINTNINEFDKIINDELKEENYSYSLDYGRHYFPEKIYKGIKYEEGMYESLLVTLGDGKGDNWWCVLFPPLCVLEAEEKDIDQTEYKFFIKELIQKYF